MATHVTAPEAPLEGASYGFTYIGAIESLTYCIELLQRRIKADKARGWSSSMEEFRLAELVSTRDFILTEHEERLGYAFETRYTSTEVSA